MDPGTTCWTLIEGAADGSADDRSEFARRYEPVVRAFLAARWRGTPLEQEIDDAVQEVFVECLRDRGALQNASPNSPGSGFRGFLYGVTRNVFRRLEERRANRRESPPGSRFSFSGIEADEESLASTFDRAWSLTLLDEANEVHAARARVAGEEAVQRLEILRLRLNHELPIRKIAEQLDLPVDAVHYEYRKARREFLTALEAVLEFHYPADPEGRQRELQRLRDLAR